MKNVLVIDKLHKTYKNKVALNQLSLSIPEGSCFGILGPNGSGKTTTLALCLGVLKPDSGTYHWFEERDNQAENRKKIGAILEKPNFYPHLNALDNLRIVAEIKGIDDFKTRSEHVLHLLNLWGARNQTFQTYSLGMKQRLSLASALLANPYVLVLDEPTNGLDPQGIADMRNLISDINRKGVTVILASHLLVEVQKLCSHFAVLNQGKLIYEGLVAALNQDNGVVEIQADNPEDLILFCNKERWHYTQKDKYLELQFSGMPGPGVLNELLIKNGIRVNHLCLKKTNLEDKFIEILKENHA